MIYFTSNLVVLINQVVCKLYNQKSVVLDEGKIKSALSVLDFDYDNDFVKATKVFRNLIIAHGFQDGNKRTACLLLLAVCKPLCTDKALANAALDVARGKYSRDLGDLVERLYGLPTDKYEESISGSATQSSSLGQHKRASIDIAPEAGEQKVPKELDDILNASK